MRVRVYSVANAHLRQGIWRLGANSSSANATIIKPRKWPTMHRIDWFLICEREYRSSSNDAVAIGAAGSPLLIRGDRGSDFVRCKSSRHVVSVGGGSGGGKGEGGEGIHW